MSKAVLVCMRVANLQVTHPGADHSHKCHTCGEDVAMYPTSQARLKAEPAIEIRCHVCYQQTQGKLAGARFEAAGSREQLRQEARESRPFTPPTKGKRS